MMKSSISFLTFLLCFITLGAHAASSPNTIVLDEVGVKNLRIETITAEESEFEESVFALGRIESIPSKSASVSSRIPGRIVELNVHIGDTVQSGDIVAKVESRQPGDPPPVIAIHAPITGLVTTATTRLGDPVDPDKALMEIIDLSEVYAIARIPEHQAGRMKSGMKAHIRVAALPERTFDGELLRFGTSADRENGTIDAIFTIPNTGGLLRPGMRSEFSVIIAKRENVLSIPRAALQGEIANRFVYVKHFDLPNAFVKTNVEIGEMNDRYVEITSGLLPADDVVTRGAYSLSFAGASSVSLKEALDAAHGHEHAEDGSELTPEAKAEMEAAKEGALSYRYNPASSPMWKYTTIVLAVLLVASLLGKIRPSEEAPSSGADSHPETH
jgi:cobalt-zinc-cadmium efflux system membrane fusion protein